jgi:hypothetical protein
MTFFWLWVGAGCVACALAGFCAVRLGTRRSERNAADQRNAAEPSAPRPSTPMTAGRPADVVWERVAAEQPAVASERPAVVAERPARAASRPRPRPRPGPRPQAAPRPTAEQPAPEKLAVWAAQVRAGERKMSLASDGCRVTWNRTCKHGHPSWLVALGYLDPEREGFAVHASGTPAYDRYRTQRPG